MGAAKVAGVLAVALLAGCPGSVMDQFEHAKMEALATPGPVPASWEPDAVLHLSPSLVDQLVTAAIEAQGNLKQSSTFDTGVAGITATVSSDLHIDRVTVASSTRCEGCLTIDTNLSGTVDWSAAGTKGNSPVTVTAVFDADFQGVEGADGVFTLTALPHDLRKLELTVGKTAGMIQPILEGKFRAYLEENLFANAEPIEMASFGSADLPLRAMRMINEPRCVGVAMLTRSPTPGVVPVQPGKIAEGWQLDLSEDSLVDLARAASFQAGPVGHDVIVDVTQMSFGMAEFTMGLRLWRPVGKGWWRDYTATGTYVVRPNSLGLTPAGVTETGQSPGAALVDPLAALGEGVIVKAIQDAIATTVPTGFSGSGGGVTTLSKVTSANGSGGVLVLKGEMTVMKAKPKPKKTTPAPAPAPGPAPAKPAPAKGMKRPK